MALNLNLSYPLARYYNHFMESIRIYRKKKGTANLGTFIGVNLCIISMLWFG